MKTITGMQKQVLVSRAGRRLTGLAHPGPPALPAIHPCGTAVLVHNKLSRRQPIVVGVWDSCRCQAGCLLKSLWHL